MLSKQERNLGLPWLSSEAELIVRALMLIGYAIRPVFTLVSFLRRQVLSLEGSCFFFIYYFDLMYYASYSHCIAIYIIKFVPEPYDIPRNA